MRTALWKRAAAGLLLLTICCCAAWARGEEHLGNQPVTEANYGDWPGILPVLNHPSRVYRTWVNGNEHFYYHGDVAALNDTLRRFGASGVRGREVVLRPGPAETQSFDGSRKIPYGWQLQLVGGIAGHLTSRDRGDRVWPKHPVLTVYVGGPIDLEKIELPAGAKAASISELKTRVREGLKSSDKTVRGWTNGMLAGLDPYDVSSRDAIAAMLGDADNWVRLNAVMALSQYGRAARPLLPRIRELLATDAHLKEQASRTIQAIEAAPDRSAAEREHRETLDRIDRYLAQRKG